VRVDSDHDVDSRALRIHADAGDTRGCGMDRNPYRRREVDARVNVATRTERVVRLQSKARATERLADNRSRHDSGDGKALVAWDLRGDDQPNESSTDNNPNDP
jgi:hypothetical protein